MTSASLDRDALSEHCLPSVLKALSDSSAAVRREAVLACSRLSSVCSNKVLAGAVDRMYAMVRDDDPVVCVL